MPDKPINPFEHHHHHHDHDHDHDHETVEAVDPAQQSLNDALRVSFFILKLLMLVLVVYYLFLSGIFTVGSDESAVRLRFGKVVVLDDATGRKVLDEGAHFAWPYPIEQVVKIPKSEQQLEIRRAYWFREDEKTATKSLDQGPKGPLNPQLDGSMLTGDANICHARWTVKYRITDPVTFITNIADPRSHRTVIAAANAVVEAAAQQAVVYMVAQSSADMVQKQTLNTSVARDQAQSALHALGAGITVDSISIGKDVTFPLSVRDDFQEVNRAEADRTKAIEEAASERDKVIGETAGEAAEPLLALVKEYELESERTRAAGDDAKLNELDAALDKAFFDLRVPTPAGDMPIGGQVAKVINDARAFRTQTVAEVRADAELFQKLLPEYTKNPGIVRNRIWTQMIREVLQSKEVNIWNIPAGSRLEMLLNTDPKIKIEDERNKLKSTLPAGQE